MRWNTELDKKLEKLILLGKKHDEIASEFNTTKRSIGNRCHRLGLKIVSHKEYQCKQCGEFFIDLISKGRKFCSKRCAASFNNLGRTHTEGSKEKIRKKLTGLKKGKSALDKLKGESNPNWKGGKFSVESKKIRTEDYKNRKCKYCSSKKDLTGRKLICDDCRFEYYEAYRPACEFKFDVNDFKEEFNFTLVEQHGWYSPSNKGNNLYGVSRDHLYSVREGFVNNIDPEIISHPANCNLMKHSDNSSKHSSSSITLGELKERIERWDEKYKI